MTGSLYQRLGETPGITAIANDLIDLHLDNPLLASRFTCHDVDDLKNSASTFFISGTGGPAVYKGQDLVTAHRHMNISATEFMAFLDDALEALARNKVAQREQEEVLYVLVGMRKEVMGL